MDRTGWIVVSVCVALMIGWYSWYLPWAAKNQPQPQPRPAVPAAVTPAPKPDVPGPPAVEDAPEELAELKSDLVRFEFTNQGGGIKVAEMRKHSLHFEGKEKDDETKDPVTLNSSARFAIGALGDAPGSFSKLAYTEESRTDSEIVYVGTQPDGLQVRKRFYLNGANENQEEKASEDHVIHLEITLTNSGAQPIDLHRYEIYGGSAIPLNKQELFYSAWFVRDHGKMPYKNLSWFNKFGFLGMNFREERESHRVDSEELHWGGVNSQFFTTILRSSEPLNSHFSVRRFSSPLPSEPESTQTGYHGMEFALGLPQQLLAPSQAASFKYDIYLGPREYRRLAKLPDYQKWAMAYDKIPFMGWLGRVSSPISQGLVWLLDRLGALLGNFGFAVIGLTILVRLAMWPLHAKAHGTSKRMAQLTPKITAIKEKYADDPQKTHQETMKLWSDYGINPMGGCLPAFVQMPIFIGYFRMLSSAAELRHEPFVFWLRDLSAPDTIFLLPEWVPLVGGGPFNLLPFLMAGTSYLQFAMMPQTGDKNQRMMFMMMPIMFLFFCYNYASALALYWTTQNIISMGQTWILNKRPIPELKKRKKKGGSTWMQRLQAQAEAAQKAQAAKQRGSSTSSSKPKKSASPSADAGGGAPAKAKTSFERGERSTKSKRKGRGGKK